MSTRVVVAYGSNLGRREETISSALSLLGEWVRAMRGSGLYASDAMYRTDQPSFLNGVVLGRTLCGPQELLQKIKQIEHDLGRKERERNGPRELDLDLVAYGSLIFRSERLVVPHPRLGERRFVLEPLVEVEPDFLIPGQGTARALLAEPLVQMQRLERIGDAPLPLYRLR